MNGIPARPPEETRAEGGEEEGRQGAAPGRRSASRRKLWYLLLVLPYIGLLWPPWYTRSEPTLFSFPFFYWYQFLWVPVSAVLTGIAYLATRGR